MRKQTIIGLGAAAALIATPALAHTGHGPTSGFLAGLAHPVLGADHLLAMLSVGAWSALAAPKNAWAAPAAFVLAMTAGIGLALTGAGLPAVEGMIAASVLALGLMLATGARLPLGAGLALAGLFAVFHGHAHAAEATGAIGAYVAGLLLATVAIHAAGIGIGKALFRRGLVRVAVGAAVTVTGAVMMAGL